MNYFKVLTFIAILIFSNLTHGQLTQKPSLSQKNSSTLIIDSIPIKQLKEYHLTGITNNNYKSLLAYCSISDYSSFSVSQTQPYLTIGTNAFIHNSLFNPIVYGSQQKSWDNPYCSDSLGEGIVLGTINVLGSLLQKN